MRRLLTLRDARIVAADLLREMQEQSSSALAFYSGQFGVPESEDHGDVWVFNWNATRYQETGDIMDQILVGPIAVPKSGSGAFVLGTWGRTEEVLNDWRASQSVPKT